MSILKKTASACGSVMRVLMGAGALALLVIGIKSKTRKNSRNNGSAKVVSGEEESKNR